MLAELVLGCGELRRGGVISSCCAGDRGAAAISAAVTTHNVGRRADTLITERRH